MKTRILKTVAIATTTLIVIVVSINCTKTIFGTLKNLRTEDINAKVITCLTYMIQ